MTRHRVLCIGYAAGFLALLVATFANYALQELGHDEGMYLGASYLAIDHDLYRDVGYFQAPNLPLLLSHLYAWSGASEFLLWGRIVTFVHHALTLTLLALIAWHQTGSAVLSFLFTMWIGLNGFLFGAGYSIDNTTYATTFLLAGYYALIRAQERSWPDAAMAAAGLLAALAPGFKLNYLPLYACFVVALMLYAPRRAVGFFVVGSIVGSLPSLIMLLDRPATFWFDNVTWHRTLLAMNVDEMGTDAMAAGFASDAWHYLTRVPWLATMGVLAPLAIGLAVLERIPLWRFDRAVLAAVIIASCITIVALGAVRFWYLQPLAVAISLLIPSLYAQISSKKQAVVVGLLVAAAAASALSQMSSLVAAPRVIDVRHWTSTRYSALGAHVAQFAPNAHQESVAVVGNPAIVYGVEGAMPLGRSSATGAFVRVSSPVLSELARRDDRITSYGALSNGDFDAIIATVDYVDPRGDIEAYAWCESQLDDADVNELVHGWCNAGYQSRIVGDGPARVVVFYR